MIAPPNLFLGLVRSGLRKDIGVAAQNAYHAGSGEYTGEVRYVRFRLLMQLDYSRLLVPRC